MRLLDASLESRNMPQKAAAAPSAAAVKERHIAMHILAPSASHRASHCPTYLLRRSDSVLGERRLTRVLPGRTRRSSAQRLNSLRSACIVYPAVDHFRTKAGSGSPNANMRYACLANVPNERSACICGYRQVIAFMSVLLHDFDQRRGRYVPSAEI